MKHGSPSSLPPWQCRNCAISKLCPTKKRINNHDRNHDANIHKVETLVRNQISFPRKKPSPIQRDREKLNVSVVIIFIRGVYGIEKDHFAPWDFHGESKINEYGFVRYLQQSGLIGVKYTKSFITVNWLYDSTIFSRCGENREMRWRDICGRRSGDH